VSLFDDEVGSNLNEFPDAVVGAFAPRSGQHGFIGNVFQIEWLGEFLIPSQRSIACTCGLSVDEETNHSEKGVWSGVPLRIAVVEVFDLD
jgi:hypothetical protein